MRVAEPVWRVRAVDQSERDQGPVDDTVERIEHPLPGYRRERDRNGPRQDDQSADDLAPREGPEQQQRAELAEDKAEQLRAEGEEKGVAERLQEDRVVQDLSKIGEPHEAPGRIIDRVGAERIIHREQERHTDQKQDVEDRGRYEDRAQHVAAVQNELKARCSLCGDWIGDDSHWRNSSVIDGPLAVLVEIAQRAL